MKEQIILLLILAGFGFFGSLLIFMPTIPSSDWTYLFRKENKEKYIAYSNRHYGMTFLSIGCTSLFLLFLSLTFKVEISPYFILGCLLVYCLFSMVRIEIKWQKLIRQ